MSRSAVGFDVGGSHVRGCAIWEEDGAWRTGQVHKTRWRQDGDSKTPSDLGDILTRMREAVAASSPVTVDFARIGIGIAAQLDRSASRVKNAPNIGWRDVSLSAELTGILGQAPVLINDVDAILVGERAFGAARGVDDVLAVFVGTGVGGAIVAGGQLIGGGSGTAGEIGHVKVLGYDGLCGCGELGCVESISGGVALHRRLALDGQTPSVTSTESAFVRGESYATELWSEVSDALGHVVAAAVTLLNPELLLMGGGVLERAPSLRLLVEERTRALTLAASRPALRIQSPELGDLAGPLGAAIHACEH